MNSMGSILATTKSLLDTFKSQFQKPLIDSINIMAPTNVEVSKALKKAANSYYLDLRKAYDTAVAFEHSSAFERASAFDALIPSRNNELSEKVVGGSPPSKVSSSISSSNDIIGKGVGGKGVRGGKGDSSLARKEKRRNKRHDIRIAKGRAENGNRALPRDPEYFDDMMLYAATKIGLTHRTWIAVEKTRAYNAARVTRVQYLGNETDPEVVEKVDVEFQRDFYKVVGQMVENRKKGDRFFQSLDLGYMIEKKFSTLLAQANLQPEPDRVHQAYRDRSKPLPLPRNLIVDTDLLS